MYQILIDKKLIHDARLDDYVVLNPRCNLKVNTVDSASFNVTIKHPLYNDMKKLKSIVEILQDGSPIFRGRIIDDSKDFYNTKQIDVEGVLGFFNDSIVRPFSFPKDFLEDAEYIEASSKGNVVEFFLKWLINNHNSQVEDFQKFKIGKVTVIDSNNYVYRSSSKYTKTWQILSDKLFDSSLGGYLCIRYEDDGNYIDYLSDFELKNTQIIELGKNLIDLNEETDATKTYTAIIPLGATTEEYIDEEVIEHTLSLESLPDGLISEDIMKIGDTLYSISGVEKYGWIYADVDDTTWQDVTVVENLKNKSVAYLQNEALKLSNTIQIKAVDLHFTDDDIQALRINRYIDVFSNIHNINTSYPLESLNIDLNNPQNTYIQLGKTQRTLIERSGNVNGRIEDLNKNVSNVTKNIEGVKKSVKEQEGSILDLEIDSAAMYIEIDEIIEILKDLEKTDKTISKYLEFDDNGMSVKEGFSFSVKGKEISFDTIYPVGSVYMSVNEIEPSFLFGGTWEKIQEAAEESDEEISIISSVNMWKRTA